MRKNTVLRIVANRDVSEALQHYRTEAGRAVAEEFVSALEECLTRIADCPGTGSPRYAHELDLPGVRSARMHRFPYLIVYIDRDEHIDIWRVLHTKRDIPAWLTDD